MRRILIVFALVMGIVAGASGVAFPVRSASAEDARGIPIRVIHYYDTGDSNRLGDKCGFPLDVLRFLQTDQQIVIRNETDTVIAIRTLSDGVYSRTENFTYKCELETTISVPEATFYTVYLGDERITAYSKDEFPIDPLKGIWITID